MPHNHTMMVTAHNNGLNSMSKNALSELSESGPRSQPLTQEQRKLNFELYCRKPGTRIDRIMGMIERGMSDKEIAEKIEGADRKTIGVYRKAYNNELSWFTNRVGLVCDRNITPGAIIRRAFKRAHPELCASCGKPFTDAHGHKNVQRVPKKEGRNSAEKEGREKMSEMTMGNAGAQGVMLAIEDSMMAAAMSRENEGLKAEIEKRDERIAAMCRKHAETVKELAAAQEEVEKLRKLNRAYRRDRRDAYARAIRESRDEADYQAVTWARCAWCFAIGVCLAVGIVATVVLASMG